MKFGEFLTFMLISKDAPNTQITERVLYQSEHDYKHSSKDPSAYYTVLELIITSQFHRAYIVYSRSMTRKKMVSKLINADIMDTWNDTQALLVKNASIKELVEQFIGK